ncbi:MAG: tetratricopeptide repeat protein [Archangiaceae bacterium]|nr:tetratricopeptide repeat protein [Archangiaceae bacterium]
MANTSVCHLPEGSPPSAHSGTSASQRSPESSPQLDSGVVSPVILICLAASGAPAKRPHVDYQAMHEAMSPSQEPSERFSSAASYAHYLKARLLHHDGDHRGALDELRLALASDDQNPFLMTELAEEHARLGELDRAEGQLHKVLDRFPNHAAAQLLMGRVLFEGQKIVRARAALKSAIRLKPRDPDAYLVLTQLWLDQGKPDEAVKVVEELSTALPGEPVGYKRLGMALAERNDNARAEKLLAKAVERDPGDAEAWITLGQIFETTSRLPKAEDAYVKALERDPENRDVLLAAGRLALRQDATQRARAYFEQLLSFSKDPELAVKVAFSYLAMRQMGAAVEVLDNARVTASEPRLHFYAGLVHERMHSWQKAADAYGAVTADAGDLFHESRLHRANCLSSLGKHQAALDLYKKGLEDRPDYQPLLPAYARGLERANQAKEAELVLARALADKPTPESFEALAGLYERQGRLADAISLLTDALRKRPRDELLLYALGAVYERKGEVQKSLEKMRAVLDVNPDNANAMNFIGYTLADRGLDFDEAEKLLTRALELKPDTAAYLDSLGWVFFKKGDTGKAIDTLERATEVSPGEPTIEEHLGDAYARGSRPSDAMARYKRALETLKEAPELADSKTQKSALEKKLRALEK